MRVERACVAILYWMVYLYARAYLCDMEWFIYEEENTCVWDSLAIREGFEVLALV